MTPSTYAEQLSALEAERRESDARLLQKMLHPREPTFAAGLEPHAQLSSPHAASASLNPTRLDPKAPRNAVAQRWRDLRAMLNQQLKLFESGALSLRSNGVNIGPEAVADLKRSILQFDAMIAAEDGQERSVASAKEDAARVQSP